MPWAIIFKHNGKFAGTRQAESSGNPYAEREEFPFLCEDGIETEKEAEYIKGTLDESSPEIKSKIIGYD